MRMNTFLKLTLGAFLLSSATAKVDTQTQTPLEVALVAPLTGDAAEIGQSLRFAATLALINSRKDFEKLGFDLKLTTYDDKGTPQTASEQGAAIVSNPATLVVVGSYASDTTLALAQSLKAANLGVVSPTASSTVLTNGKLPGFNRVVARGDELGRAAGQYIQKVLKSKRVLLIDDKSADGLDVSQNVAAYLKSAKIPIVGRKSTLERVNFTGLVAEIKALKPDFIFMGFSSVQSSALLLGKLRRSGVMTPLMGTSVLAEPQFRGLAGSDSKGVLYASYVAPVEAYASPLIPQFNKQFQQVLQVKPTSYSVLGYDAMTVALEALKTTIKTSKGKTPTRAQVQKALRAVKMVNALSGSLSFNKNGDLEQTNVYVLKVGNDFKPKLVSILPAVPSR